MIWAKIAFNVLIFVAQIVFQQKIKWSIFRWQSFLKTRLSILLKLFCNLQLSEWLFKKDQFSILTNQTIKKRNRTKPDLEEQNKNRCLSHIRYSIFNKNNTKLKNGEKNHFNRKAIYGLWAIDMRAQCEEIHMKHGEYETAYESKKNPSKDGWD